MSDGEDEEIIMGDEDYEEEEEAITTVTDVSSIASLDCTARTTCSDIGFQDHCGHLDDHGEETTISHLSSCASWES